MLVRPERSYETCGTMSPNQTHSGAPREVSRRRSAWCLEIFRFCCAPGGGDFVVFLVVVGLFGFHRVGGYLFPGCSYFDGNVFVFACLGDRLSWAWPDSKILNPPTNHVFIR